MKVLDKMKQKYFSKKTAKEHLSVFITKRFGIACVIGLLLFVLFLGVGETENGVFSQIVTPAIESHPEFEAISSGQLTEDDLLENPDSYLGYFWRVIWVLGSALILSFLLLTLLLTVFWNYAVSGTFQFKTYVKQTSFQLLSLFCVTCTILVLSSIALIFEFAFGMLQTSLEFPGVTTILWIIFSLLLVILFVTPFLIIFHVFLIQMPYEILKKKKIFNPLLQNFTITRLKTLRYYILPYIFIVLLIYGGYQVTLLIVQQQFTLGVILGILVTIIPFAWLVSVVPVIEKLREKK
ncbi:MAG: hypothetical protein ACMXYA_03760 [Candidatus Woesearchaeota archaeon]